MLTKIKWPEQNTDTDIYQLCDSKLFNSLYLSIVSTIEQNKQNNQNGESSLLLWRIYPKKYFHIYSKTCIEVLIMLFKIAKNSKQFEFLLLGQLLKGLKDPSHNDVVCSHYKECVSYYV